MTSMAEHETGVSPLPFGIPLLDRLLGFSDWNDPESLSVSLPSRTSMTIVGEDGTGKSVFGLHLASNYLALMQHRSFQKSKEWNHSPFPLVIYASSDLPYAAAQTTWRAFCLDFPWLRYLPDASGNDADFRRKVALEDNSVQLSSKLNLIQLYPGAVRKDDKDDKSVVRFILGGSAMPSVGFLDLAGQTAGDDWLYLARLVSSMPSVDEGKAKNLLVIDSIAGFETLVGEKNSFGEPMTRRARIAQLLRAAGDNWSLVFISEEPDNIRHQQEEYITDTVIHLYRDVRETQVRRYLEIEKARGRSFAGGRHDFEIRNGAGTSTWNWENPDDPRTLVHPKVSIQVSEACGKSQKDSWHHAYIQMFPNLEHWSIEFAARPRGPSSFDPDKYPSEGFGMPALDEMLKPHKNDEVGKGKGGLRPGTTTALIGDEGTNKAALARRFVIAGFDYVPLLLTNLSRVCTNFISSGEGTILTYLHNEIKDLTSNIPEPHADRVKERISFWNNPPDKDSNPFLKELSGLRHLAMEWQIDNPESSDRESELKMAQPNLRRWDKKTSLRKRPESSLAPALAEQGYLLALLVLRMTPGLIVPSVYVCAEDASSESLAKELYEDPKIGFKQLGNKEDKYTQLLLQKFIIVRRVDLRNTTGAKLWHCIHACTATALRMLGHRKETIMTATNPLLYANHIRIVIGDWRLLRDTYPAVKDDPLVLPTIVFRLRRLGVTTLLVDSDNGRPDQPVTDPMNRALRTLVDLQICTWKVPFFGEQRVAITVLPPLGESPGVVRELRWRRREPENPERLEVDPHFELYSGLEEGNPHPVPLKVFLYAETPAFAQYIKREADLFNRVFDAGEKGDGEVLQLLETSKYEVLRDYCNLPSDRRLPYTLVFMIDGFWGLGKTVGLRKQSRYLYESLEGSGEAKTNTNEDRFSLFASTQPFAEQNEKTEKTRRIDAFRHKVQLEGNEEVELSTRISADQDREIDRIPFMWDFAFLLCRQEAWDYQSKDASPVLSWRPGFADGWDPKGNDDTQMKVEDVWRALPKFVPDDVHKERESRTIGSIPSWRTFFEGCLLVSRNEERVRGRKSKPFDLAVTTAETVTCFVLEVWLSEALRDIKAMRHCASLLQEEPEWERRAKEWANEWEQELVKLSEKSHLRNVPEVKDQSLQHFLGQTKKGTWANLDSIYRDSICDKAEKTLDPKQRARRFVRVHSELPGLSFQLYKAWLLLLEVLDFESLCDFSGSMSLKEDRPADPSAVAARHWYKTACYDFTPSGVDTSTDRRKDFGAKIPVRLPGSYSTRGDWFLAVAEGSRSSRLADHALDLLSSRKANRNRLHYGLGLPVRDIVEPGARGNIRTRLQVETENGPVDVMYEDLLKLRGEYEKSDFRWLFRTGFQDYDRYAVAIRRWLHRWFSWTPTYRQRNRTSGKGWSGGFEAYDAISRGDFTEVAKYDSLMSFANALNMFISDLDNCQMRDGSGGTSGPVSLAGL
jgi:KaiC/GvpD/RAD55 family RecA-like ATPase